MGYTEVFDKTLDDADAARSALSRIEGSKDGESVKVLAFSTCRESNINGYDFVTYAAVEVIQNNKPRKVYAMTVLQDRSPNTYGYKFIDESMGPMTTKCPKQILDLLTETDLRLAKQFRADCGRGANVDADKIHMMRGAL